MPNDECGTRDTNCIVERTLTPRGMAEVLIKYYVGRILPGTMRPCNPSSMSYVELKGHNQY
jgi:hypothetical protein